MAAVLFPASLLLFVLLDSYAEFTAAQWVAVTCVCTIHVIFSVPALPSAIYELGPPVARPDRAMHVFAAAVATTVLWRVARVRFPRGSTWIVMLAALSATLALGIGKEITDYVSVVSSGHEPVWQDTAADLLANVIGAVVAAVFVAYAATDHRPRPVPRPR